MHKKSVAPTAWLVFSALLSVVNAQVAAASQDANLVGQAAAWAGFAFVFALVGYAGYRIIKKWSTLQPD
ncbi:MAG: hypothetical protein NWE93_12215 [Candidatus Bathyarchaeota archaeon]|nr:hypothetical protein [Candidatus Bathyarchaeota archaeon]